KDAGEVFAGQLLRRQATRGHFCLQLRHGEVFVAASWRGTGLGLRSERNQEQEYDGDARGHGDTPLLVRGNARADALWWRSGAPTLRSRQEADKPARREHHQYSIALTMRIPCRP